MQRVAVLILVACCALTALSLAEDSNKSKPPSTMSSAEAFGSSNTTSHTPKPTTTKPTTTKPTTPKPTTTKPTTTKPTTTKPTTTKPTTTKPMTTKPTTTKPTTTKPTTTKPTTPKPMTTAAPQPTPATNLTVGNYSLKTDKGVVCLKAQMALQIRLKTQDSGTFIVQPQKTTTSGKCIEPSANLTISFDQGFITFLFNKSVANNTVYVSAVFLKLSYPLTKTGTQKYSAKNESVHLFAAKIGHSYSCRNESVSMENGLSLEVSQDRMQAFNITKNEFGYPDPCPADQPDYRVAIAVGVTLLVLIVIVLIVYLLGRRRRTAGYQSL